MTHETAIVVAHPLVIVSTPVDNDDRVAPPLLIVSTPVDSDDRVAPPLLIVAGAEEISKGGGAHVARCSLDGLNAAKHLPLGLRGDERLCCASIRPRYPRVLRPVPLQPPHTELTLEPDPDPLSLISPVTRCQLLTF